VRCLVSFRLEVEIVFESMIAALVCARKDNRHVELAPSLLLNPEWGLLEHCAESESVRIMLMTWERLTLLVLLERWMKVVDGLLEAIGDHFLALVVEQADLYAPRSHRETLHR
jgi:hypothetical protein